MTISTATRCSAPDSLRVSWTRAILRGLASFFNKLSQWERLPQDLRDRLQSKGKALSTLADGSTDIDPKPHTGSNFAYRALRWARALIFSPG